MKTDTPTTFVVFGVTGDLSRRKLIPALFDLYAKEVLPREFRMVGFSRGVYRKEEFQNFVGETILATGRASSKELIKDFVKCTYHCQGAFEEPDAYVRIAKTLASIDESELRRCSNKLFYLAVSPAFYATIFDRLASSGLTIPCGGKEGWTRVLVEKPFGKDANTAEALEHQLSTLFREEQIFRIDHYLAKETVQNILAFRFSNILFEPLWSREYIERVEISLCETAGVEGRGSLYDGLGALRDVGQNHLLQMLALVAMDDPKEMDARLIREARAAALNALRLVNAEDMHERVRRGQYAGYTKEENVPTDSVTETSFRAVAYLDNERWRDVPFVLEAGKRMLEHKAEIRIYFKRTERCLCPPGAEHHHQNILTFRIQPNEGIEVVFWAKKPGFATELEQKRLSFSYKESFEEERLPDAYERVLYDCIRGDQTLFASTEEVQAAWKFVMSILENWSGVSLEIY